MLLSWDQTVPQVVLKPAFLRVDSLTHVELPLGEKACHVVTDVSRVRGEDHIKGEHFLVLEEISHLLNLEGLS